MKKTVSVFGIILLAATAFAQNAAPAPKVSAPPVLTDSQKAKFFKAQLNYERAQAQVDRLQTVVQSAVDAMKATCGPDSQLTLDQSGDPVCVAVPAKK